MLFDADDREERLEVFAEADFGLAYFAVDEGSGDFTELKIVGKENVGGFGEGSIAFIGRIHFDYGLGSFPGVKTEAVGEVVKRDLQYEPDIEIGQAA